MKRVILFVFSNLLLYNLCLGQENPSPKNSAISLELGKSGFIYNLSYDQKLAMKPFGFRAMIGSNFAQYLNAFQVGVGGYYLMGNSKHALELGADLLFLKVEEVSDDQRGFTILYPNFPTNTIYPSMNVGYRRYGKKTLFRIGATPGVILDKFVSGGYLSLGMLF